MDCFRKLLADEIIAPREFAVCKLGMLRLGPSRGDFLSLGSFFELGLLKKLDRSPAAATVNFRAEVQPVGCARWVSDRAGSPPYATGARS